MFIIEKPSQEEIELIRELEYDLISNDNREWEYINYKGQIIKLEKKEKSCSSCQFTSNMDCSKLYVITNQEDLSTACRIASKYEIKVVTDEVELLKLAFQQNVETIKIVECL